MSDIVRVLVGGVFVVVNVIELEMADVEFLFLLWSDIVRNE